MQRLLASREKEGRNMNWVVWIFVGVIVILAGAWLSDRHMRAKKGLILALLQTRGELTGMDLRDAGVGALVYNCLYELEKEGLVERRLDERSRSERGGIPSYFYKLKGAWA